MLAQALPARAFQVPSPEVVEEVKRLVAMVECRAGGTSRVGAGIVFGGGPDTLYIATADHVVRACRARADSVLVRLRNRPDETVGAILSAEADTALDLAVLKVTGEARTALPADSLPFDRLGDPEAVGRGDLVYSLGWRGRPWALTVTAEPVAENAGDRLYYESDLIGPGHSGGALLDTELLLLGMLRSDQPPWGEALSIARVLDRVRTWGYPVQLVRQFVPDILASIHVGAHHMCGLDADGAAYCWGRSGPQMGTGVLGSVGSAGSAPRESRTTRVVGDRRFRTVDAGSESTCGLTDQGAAWCWGLSRIGPAGSEAQFSAYTPTRVGGDLHFRALAFGEYCGVMIARECGGGFAGHMCGVTNDGSAYCWGANRYGQLGDGTADNSTLPVRVVADVRFVTISAAGPYACALTPDGAAYCWGANMYGVVGADSLRDVRVPARVSGDLRFRSISASTPYDHVCGVTVEGDAFCWGNNMWGQLGNGGSGEDRSTPTAVAGGLKFGSVTTGPRHSCGVASSGEAYCWGDNANGQLGTGTEDGSLVPAPVAGGLRFASLSIAPWPGRLTCGLAIDGSTYCWGRADVQAQVGAEFPMDTPVRVPHRIRP